MGPFLLDLLGEGKEQWYEESHSVGARCLEVASWPCGTHTLPASQKAASSIMSQGENFPGAQGFLLTSFSITGKL